MWSIAKSVLTGAYVKLAAVATLIIGLLLYGMSKKRQGRLEQIQHDMEKINEAVVRKQEDRRSISQPVPVERRRERVRSQRNELNKLLRSE